MQKKVTREFSANAVLEIESFKVIVQLPVRWALTTHVKGRMNPATGLICRHPGGRCPFHGRRESLC